MHLFTKCTLAFVSYYWSLFVSISSHCGASWSPLASTSAFWGTVPVSSATRNPFVALALALTGYAFFLALLFFHSNWTLYCFAWATATSMSYKTWFHFLGTGLICVASDANGSIHGPNGLVLSPILVSLWMSTFFCTPLALFVSASSLESSVFSAELQFRFLW